MSNASKAFFKSWTIFLSTAVTILCRIQPGLADLNNFKKTENIITKNHVDDRPEILLLWALKLTDVVSYNNALETAHRIAKETGTHNVGQVGHLKGHFLFTYLPPEAKDVLTSNDSVKLSISHLLSFHKRYIYEKDYKLVSETLTAKLIQHPLVDWVDQQTAKSRQKRAQVNIIDPYFSKQWHLVNHVARSMDINVTGVWEKNITGKGVTVAIVDDGLEWTNPDILPNYSSEGSWDLNSEDSNPMPSGTKSENHHGTRCAGEVAAAVNQFCGVGVAYTAKVSGLRVLDGPMTDSLEATAFTKNMHINDIYSCSWGPDDDGKTVDGPHILAKKAMRHGIDFGRRGYGSIYVVASGNGGEHRDNCNYDGYANSIYTITIGAVDETGHMPYYGEECSSMLAVTFSSGGRTTRSIVTTDWRKDGATGCTVGHTGTSAAAPLAAGMIALMLQARYCLSWRDVQYLIVLTALKVDINVGQWQKNGAGLHHSLQHGFGLMKAWRMVNAAKVWDTVPWMTSYNSEVFTPVVNIPKNNQQLILNKTVTESMLLGYGLRILEQVQLIVTLSHWRRGNLVIRLVSPSGTDSLLGAARPRDQSGEGLTDWMFTTVRCWGEEPVGNWQVIISDKSNPGSPEGVLRKWQLRLFGSPMTTEEFQNRRRLIEEAMSGQFLNDSYNLPCPSPSVYEGPEKPVISDKALKILLLSGAFIMFMALYETMEYALCYNDEKKEHTKMLGLSARAQRLARQHNGATYYQIPGEQDTSIGMEEESIAMETFSEHPLLEDSDATEDVLYSASGGQTLHQETYLQQHLTCSSDIPKEILDTLSPDEIKLNLNYQHAANIKKKPLTGADLLNVNDQRLSSIDCDDASSNSCLLPVNSDNQR